MIRQRWLANVFAFLAILLAAAPIRADEASATKALKKLGCSIQTVGRKPDAPVWYVEMTNDLAPKVTDADLRLLKEFK